MSELKLTDRVSIDNLVSWDCHFRATEAERDIVIPANVKGYKQLTLAEIDGQVKMGNGFFCGTDSYGGNASIKINDKEVKDFVFGISENEEKSTQLDLNTVKDLLSVKTKTAFVDKLKKVVATEAEKKMIIPLAIEAGIEDCESFKTVEIEKYTGFKFD